VRALAPAFWHWDWSSAFSSLRDVVLGKRHHTPHPHRPGCAAQCVAGLELARCCSLAPHSPSPPSAGPPPRTPQTPPRRRRPLPRQQHQRSLTRRAPLPRSMRPRRRQWTRWRSWSRAARSKPR
jgi:hypothetical protein